MDTELLRTFLEVRNTRHFGRAAENLCITQAAVSARIKQLEESLGAALFTRSRNNIQLSAEGERLVPHAETVLLALARARHEVQLGDTEQRQVRMGVRSGLWGGALQSKFSSLRESDAELCVNLASLEPGEALRKLLDRSLDCALLCEPPGMPELENITVGEFSLRLYGSAGRLSLRKAIDAAYVYLDWGGGFARFHARHFGDQALPRLQTNLDSLALACVLAEGGACYLPASRRQELAQQGLNPVRGAPVYTRQLSLVYHPDSPQRDVAESIARRFSGVKV
ncbi:LysR family transcriptional regulator [Parahaliea maris]|uniref:LysR family transcriptional regulator n=1 Tax=Parahaliea maris TaxID=2716870 RepID=A0A5C8ZSS8_9GAMM|nr:LysR family transcriptional regulator [Parahaliea maris]TXS90720.1 LysR family transcriptional regulator [Parahaliea maris]